MLGTLGDGAVMGSVNGTLGDSAVMGLGNGTLGAGDVVGSIVVRYFSIIFCRVLVACNCSSPIDNRDFGAGLLRASVKFSSDLCAASAKDSFGTGQSCGKNSAVFIILSTCISGT